MVVDASIVVRLLQNRAGDEPLRERFGQQRHVHALQLIDAEVASAIRGLLLTSKAEIRISLARAGEMLEDVADLSVTTRSAYHCSLMTGSTTGPRVTPRSSRPIHSLASWDGRGTGHRCACAQARMLGPPGRSEE